MRAKIAIVTGAARGIGAAINAALHREGWVIVGPVMAVNGGRLAP